MIIPLQNQAIKRPKVRALFTYLIRGMSDPIALIVLPQVAYNTSIKVLDLILLKGILIRACPENNIS